MYLKLIFLAGALLLSDYQSIGQNLKLKFGKISIDDLKKSSYEIDTSASAIVLADIGKTEFRYNESSGISLLFSHHLRIKILKTEGYDQANQTIVYYTPSGEDEKVGAIKGYTHNLVDGKIVSTKLTKDGIFNENTHKTTKKRKITLPEVKVGSIIELRYSISSPYVQYFRNWNFQNDIPTLWSEYTALTSEYFNYKVRMEGYISPSFSDNKIYSNDPSLGQMKKSIIIYKNVPAFIDEPYMTSKGDYISKVMYELSNVSIPGQAYKNYSNTWEEVKKTYLESSSFGLTLNATGFTNKIIDELALEGKPDIEKSNQILTHLKRNMKWTGYNSDYVPSTLRKAYEDKEGNCTEINLILVACLRKAGIQAYPVLLSTRNNGFLRTFSPNSEQFNYTACLATIDGKSVLLDATNVYLPNFMIPQKCLNGKGLVIQEGSVSWVNLKSPKPKSTKVSASFELTDDGELEGSVKSTYDGYNASNKRKSVFKDGESTYIDEFVEESSWEIEEVEIADLKDYNSPLSISYDILGENDIESLGNMIYITPILIGRDVKNPFKSEKREYPVDFACPITKSYMAQIKIPEGYVVAEKPTNSAIGLPSKGGKYTFSITPSPDGKLLTIISRLKINKSMFVQDEYPYLKAFYEQMISKQAEQIVLKKS
ncbi:MAG: DUF3857 domain-containing protein [Reichenbachiella sp.]